MGFGYWLLILLALLLLAVLAFIFVTRTRAQRQGLPAPPLSSYNPFSDQHATSTRTGGALGWVKSKFASLRGGGNRGGGNYSQQRGLDPDGAWDTRVGVEADHGGYYEEQELGLHPGGGTYAGNGYGRSHALPEYGEEPEQERGRSRSRDDGFIGGGQRGLDQRYDEEMGRVNPFGVGAERSELGGAPAELDAGSVKSGKQGKKDGGRDSHGDSPTERRSMFREDV